MARPSKFDNVDLKSVEALAKKGWTDKEMADFFKVTEQTWNNWKKRHNKFFESLKEWKNHADEAVERALYDRAVGYSTPDVHISNYQGIVTITPIIKHYPPSEVACIFWLKNRKKEEWKDRIDNYEHKELDLPEDIDSLCPDEVDELYEKLKNNRNKA